MTCAVLYGVSAAGNQKRSHHGRRQSGQPPAIATFAKAKDNQNLTSTQAKSVYDLLAQGKENGYTDLQQAIKYVKEKLLALKN